jgi:hypothetical protein
VKNAVVAAAVAAVTAVAAVAATAANAAVAGVAAITTNGCRTAAVRVSCDKVVVDTVLDQRP